MRKFSLFMLMAVGLLISGNLRAEKTLVATMTALEQTTSFYMDEAADVPNHVYASAYDALTAALAALPENSTPATIKLFSDVQFVYEKSYLIIQKYRNVTIDLNGHEITTSTEYVGGAQLIENKGTLIIDDSSEGKNGTISNLPFNADTQEIPSYGKYLIKNTGSLILNNGTLEVTPPAGADACYIVENEVSTENNNSSSFIMNGGKLEMLGAVSTIRIQMNNPKSGATNTVEIKGGELKSGDHVIDIHSNGSTNMPNITVNISGGTLTSTRTDQPAAILRSIVMGNNCDHHLDAVHINITGGTLNGALRLGEAWGINRKPTSVEQVSITGGTFMKQPCIVTKLSPYVVKGCEVEGEYKGFITGGIFANFEAEGYANFQANIDGYIAEGYKAVPCTDEGFNSETDLKIDVVKKETKPVTEDIDLNDLNPTNLTDLTIENQGTEGKTTITVQQNTTVEVEKLTVKNSSEYGEAQIVVSTGATLKLGNGGLVSENDEITTVLVEPGGTFIIGVGGVTDKGDATPIEVKNNAGNGAGVVLFNPNSKEEATQRYAEVDLYTYCKKEGEKYSWQQFAIPVTKIGASEDLKPVVNPVYDTYMFKWDYTIYGWSPLNEWKELTTPFAGYDVTNVSPEGGVVYTFKGDLIGNQNTQLTLPNKNYCVMGNSYTAPIDLDALFDQIKKEMDQEGQDIIEQTVYKYDAKKKYYVWTNKLGLELAKAGILDPEFVDIKPMEGFLLNLQNGNTAGVMLNYANAVFNPAMNNVNGGSKAPRQNNSTDFVVAKINITSAHSIDLVTLVEGGEFSAEIENGKDAFKYLNEDGANLYAFDGTNKLAMVATDNLEGTMLAFQAAEDAEYTLTFDRALNADYTLVDLQNGNEIEMIEGNSYTFTAAPNSLNPSRFMVIASAQAPTKMNQTKASKVAKGIYTMAGQYLGNAETFNAMPQGVYMVNGVKVIK